MGECLVPFKQLSLNLHGAFQASCKVGFLPNAFKVKRW